MVSDRPTDSSPLPDRPRATSERRSGPDQGIVAVPVGEPVDPSLDKGEVEARAEDADDADHADEGEDEPHESSARTPDPSEKTEDPEAEQVPRPSSTKVDADFLHAEHGGGSDPENPNPEPAQLSALGRFLASRVLVALGAVSSRAMVSRAMASRAMAYSVVSARAWLLGRARVIHALAAAAQRDRRLAWGLVVASFLGIMTITVVYSLTLRVQVPSSQRAAAAQSATSVLLSRPLVLRVGQELDESTLDHLWRTKGFRNESRDAEIDDPRYSASQPPSAVSEPSRTSTLEQPFASPRSSARYQRFDETDRVRYQVALPSDHDLTVVLSKPPSTSRTSPRLIALALDGEETNSFDLGPIELATYLSDDLIDRRPVTFGAMPPHLVHAVLAAEDDQFFHHHGVAVAGIARAAMTNLRAGRIVQGASTITQQVARNLFLSQERSWTRKLNEARLALALEARWSKEDILEAYLNKIYLGSRWHRQLVGVGAASQVYFGVEPQDLTIAESALLAGMIASPARFDPISHPEAATLRRNRVVSHMSELGWITDAQAQQASTEAITLRPGYRPLWVDHYARLAAREADRQWNLGPLEGSGIKLHSTLDWFEQSAALTSLDEGLLGKAYEGAIVSLDPTSGEILAYLGGSPTRRSEFDRAGRANRQIGSLVKPFTYAAAFQSGVATPVSQVLDLPLEIRFGNTSWIPSNGGDRYRGTVTLAKALALSLNTAAVRVALATGLDQVVDTLRAAGLDQEVNHVDGPSVALGALQASPLQMASAYGAFAAAGVLHQPVVLTGYERYGQAVLQLPTGVVAPKRLIDENSAFLISDALRGVVTSGTGWRINQQLPKDPISGKTGTSNDGRDAWFVGYTAERVAAVWLGFDDFSEADLSGGQAAVPIWGAFAERIRPSQGFTATPRPKSLRWKDLPCHGGRRPAVSGWFPVASGTTDGQAVETSDDDVERAVACGLVGGSSDILAQSLKRQPEPANGHDQQGSEHTAAGGTIAMASYDPQDRGTPSAGLRTTALSTPSGRLAEVVRSKGHATPRGDDQSPKQDFSSPQLANNPVIASLAELQNGLRDAFEWGYTAPKAEEPSTVAQQARVREVFRIDGPLGTVVSRSWQIAVAPETPELRLETIVGPTVAAARSQPRGELTAAQAGALVLASFSSSGGRH